MALLAIAKIRTDGGTQPRAAIDASVVEEYAYAMLDGVKFPPLTVFYDGSEYWLADGFHRLNAATEAGIPQIDCDVHQGTQQDAQWFSFAANKTNGLRRSTEDKQRAVKAALMHPLSQGRSDNAIAVHVGVDHKTVRYWREQMVTSWEIPKIDSRTVVRNGKSYQQNVSNIGPRPKPAAEAQPDVRLARNEKGESSNLSGGSSSRPVPQPRELPTVSRDRAWAAQETRHFTREWLKLLKFYEKTHDQVEALVVVRDKGIPVDIRVVFVKESVA